MELLCLAILLQAHPAVTLKAAAVGYTRGSVCMLRVAV